MSDVTGLRCFAITGPTACGKTDLAVALANELPLEIVSMDSALVYRGMDIGTAKPSIEIRSEVPHHLIDIIEPEDNYSAGRFVTDAVARIAEINSRNKLALLVGGTMLYLKALRGGMAPLPERDPDVRARIDDQARSQGWRALHAELTDIDPVAAAKIAPNDRQRIQRALEVFRITGRPISDIQRDSSGTKVAVESLALMPSDRASLAEKIERRFNKMVEQGLVEEVRRLRSRPGLYASSASMRAVGYRQIWAFLDGRWEWPEAASRAIAATRQLAKRQLTWLRGDAQSVQLDSCDPEVLEKLRLCVRKHSDSA
jgi:tRNA dimethylallyltransferase